ncbi:MAG: M17 family metallopeptidase [Microgenomates group bacterium]
MTPRFADQDALSRPLTVVRPDTLQSVLNAQPLATQSWMRETKFAAGLGEILLIPGPTGVIGAFLGLGDAAARARLRFGAAKSIKTLPAGAWHIDGDMSSSEMDELTLGWMLQLYSFDRYRPSKQPSELPLLKRPVSAAQTALQAMASGEYLTRDLINTPASDLGPDELEAAFLDLAARFGATSTVVRGDDLLTQGFPMIHAVGRASPRAPRLLEMRWGNRGPKLTLVGKGVCFDTGGLNIKPSSGMLLMKKDMGGAATVLGLAQMIMQLNLPVQLRVIVGAVENVISGNAMKPKDILTSRKGLTVEVNDTDAEGRLVLGDALAYACEEPHDVLISMATLTGAARVAVGPDLAPYYSDDAGLVAALEVGAIAGFDPVWRLPFWTPYETIIEPGIADLDNAPGWGFAGSVTAALFLRRFVDGPRYMHFDIYGHSPADAPGRPKGGAGQGARAILNALPAMLGF